MTKETYQDNLKAYEVEFEIKKKSLAKDYAFSNNPHQIGDVITDNNTTIKIEKIKHTLGNSYELPECVYYGVELKKDGTPKKNGKLQGIWQRYVIK